MKNIFNSYGLKRYVWFSLHHFLIPQYFLHLFKKLLLAIVISSHMEEKQDQYVSSEEFKGKGTFFVCEWLRKEDQEKPCEIFES